MYRSRKTIKLANYQLQWTGRVFEGYSKSIGPEKRIRFACIETNPIYSRSHGNI